MEGRPEQVSSAPKEVSSESESLLLYVPAADPNIVIDAIVGEDLVAFNRIGSVDLKNATFTQIPNFQSDLMIRVEELGILIGIY